MKKLLLSLFLISSALTAAEKVIINPSLNEDTVIKANISGTATEVLRVNASSNRVEANTITAIGGGSVNFPGGASGISAQITDLTLGTVADPLVTVKGGGLLLPDGREMLTYDGAGSLVSDFSVDLAVDLDTLLGSNPVDATSYTVALDINSVVDGTVISLSSGRQIYPIEEDDFLIFEGKVSSDLDPAKYVAIGIIRSATTGTVWSGAGAEVENYSTKYHRSSSSVVSEKSYIPNGSGLYGVSGWSESNDLQVDITKTVLSSELPRENTTRVGLKIVGTGGGGLNHYVKFPFLLDDDDVSKKLKISFAKKDLPGYVSGEFDVVIRDVTNSVTIDPNVSDIAAGTSGFLASFDTTASLSYELWIRKPLAAVSAGFVISDLIVGPGKIVQVATGSKAMVAGYASANQTGLAHATSVKIDFDTEDYDSQSSFNPTTNTFTALYAGKYLISAQATIKATTSPRLSTGYISIYKNGSPIKFGNSVEIADLASTDQFVVQRSSISTTVELAVGEEITFYAFGSVWNGGTWLIDGGSEITYFSVDLVEREDNALNLLADGEALVVSRFTAKGLVSAQVVNSASAVKIVNWNNTYNDPNFSNDNYVIPADGDYRIDAKIFGTTLTNGTHQFYLYKNGSEIIYRDNKHVSADTSSTFSISGVEPLLKGDTLDLRYAENSTSSVTISSTGAASWFSVTRVSEHTAGQAVGFGLASATESGLVKMDPNATTNNVGEYESGSYTPTYDSSGSSNVIGASGGTSWYVRVGNVVTVGVFLAIDPDSGTASTLAYFDLPITTAQTQITDVVGSANSFDTGSNLVGQASIEGAGTGSRFRVRFRRSDIINRSWRGTFVYVIK